MRTAWSYVVVGLGIALMAPKVAAQSSISCGETASGSVSGTGQLNYTFTANAGEAVIFAVVATSGTLQPVARLLAPDGTDRGGTPIGGTSSSIPLTQTGTHTIRVSDFSGSGSGTFNLTLEFTTGRCARAINCGDTLSSLASLVASDMDTYSFSATAGEAGAAE